MITKKHLRKIVPFIPLLGVYLTFKYHEKYGDTGIENNVINILSAIFQGVSITFLLFYFFKW